MTGRRGIELARALVPGVFGVIVAAPLSAAGTPGLSDAEHAATGRIDDAGEEFCHRGVFCP